MPFEDVRSHFGDILESLNSISLFVEGMDLARFREDAKTRQRSNENCW